MSSHIEIVSVTYRRGKKGERESNVFSNWTINRPDPDDWSEDLPLYDLKGNEFPEPPQSYQDAFWQGVFIDLPEDWFGMRFIFFGQFFEWEQSCLELECEIAGDADVFEDYVKRLRKIGDELLDQRATQHAPVREVTFLTAWQYTSCASHEGECDAEWDLLGLINMSKIKEAITV